ncbi:MAG: DUF2075 domain-containing protein [Clostridiales bacterium]|nr:DUF2075 domain-containing protein [Clostridiales bacterium]
MADRNIFYILQDKQLIETDAETVGEIIKGINNFYPDDIEVLFRPSQFLVSPINTPEKFISGNYFLTDHQEAIKNEIMADRKSNSGAYAFYQVTGGAGTGKTLLIYDIAKSLAQKEKICVIHCAYLAEGHNYLNRHLRNVSIISIKDMYGIKYEDFDGIVVDESHRLHDDQLTFVCEKIKTLNKFCVFGSDGEQYLTKTEQKDGICDKIYNLEGCKHFQLTNKIRTNPELADFIHLLRKINEPVRTKSFPNVKIMYADSYEYANVLIEKYSKCGYKYISFTPSSYCSHNIDKLLKSENTHKVIGQEFDNVLMVINESFEYKEDGRLAAYEHPVPDYLFAQLLYQGLTRVREKLLLIILNNETLFEKLMGAIKNATKA